MECGSMAYRPNAGPDHQPPASKRKKTTNPRRPAAATATITAAAGPGGAQAYGKAFWTGAVAAGATEGGDRFWCYSHPNTPFGQTANSHHDHVNLNAYGGGDYGFASPPAYVQYSVGDVNSNNNNNTTATTTTTWISQPYHNLAAQSVDIAPQSFGSENILAHEISAAQPFSGESLPSTAGPLFVGDVGHGWHPDLEPSITFESQVAPTGILPPQFSSTEVAGIFPSLPALPQTEFTYSVPSGGVQDASQACYLPSPPDSNAPYPDAKSPSYYLNDHLLDIESPSIQSLDGTLAVTQCSTPVSGPALPPELEPGWVHIDQPCFDGGVPVDWVSGCYSDSAQQLDIAEAADLNYSLAPEAIEDDYVSDGDRKRKIPATRFKACLRCRFQKLKCLADPDDPEGGCIPCKTFSRTSKKTIHRAPCFRKKITDVVLFRSGGLGLTRRWTGTQMRNIASRNLLSGSRTIEFTQSPDQVPIIVRVAAFKPIIGDVTSRFWTVMENGHMVQKSKDIKPFCLVNVHETASYFEKYIIDNAITDFIRRGAPASSASAGSTDVIRRTYMMAVQHYSGLEDQAKSDEGASTVNREKRLLGNLFILWFAIRQTTGSAYICGEDKLDMIPEVSDPSYPLRGRVSLPRMLLAQFDSINHTKLLAPYRLKVLRDLEWLIKRNKKRNWLTLYLCLFVLLREASWISEDRARHAKAVHQAQIRYSIPHFVESLQEGCNMLLMYWHYYNCRPMPDPEQPNDKEQSFLSDLTTEQYQLIMDTMKSAEIQDQLVTWKTYAAENGALPSREKPNGVDTKYTGSQSQISWDHPYYWIAQLFEEKWNPHPTYQREHVP